MKTFVSLMTSDDFLPGILALNQSLLNYNSCENLLVLVSSKVSDDAVNFLNNYGIKTKTVDPIDNPNTKMDFPRFKNNYTKLHIFGLIKYEKIVYLDADMLICSNIDELFDKPHWSAVNAGGLLPEFSHWVKLNSGLLVIEPNIDTFSDIINCIDYLPSKNGGDQGFLHSYFPEWPNKQELHLDHKYNVYVEHVDRYCQLFGYKLLEENIFSNQRVISVLHFWGPNKPWYCKGIDTKLPKYNKAIEMWWKCFEKANDKSDNSNTCLSLLQ